MSDQADGLRQLVRTRSGTTAPVRLKDRAQPDHDTVPERPPREARAGFFASLAARWAMRQTAR
jgi:hypothetical protein